MSETAESGDDLVAQLRRALGGGFDPVAPPAPPRPSSAVEVVAEVVTQIDDVPSPKRPAIGAEALQIADSILGLVPTYSAPPGSRPLALRRGDALLHVPTTGVVLGRKPGEGGLVIDDRHASREHARVVDVEGALQLVDLGSSNGTTVLRGPDRLTVGDRAVMLLDGDRIVTVDDVFLCEVEAASEGRR